MNYKKIVLLSIIIGLFFGLFNHNIFAQNTNPLCSTSLRGTSPSHKPQDLYKPDSFKIAYMIATKSISSSDILNQASINGNIARHNNFSNCNPDSPTSSEKSARESRRTNYKNLPSVNISIINNNVSLADAKKLQQFINTSCALTLNEDGKLGIKTLNSILYCKPAANGYMSWTDFQSLYTKLYLDENGKNKLRDGTKYLGDPSGKLYIKQVDLGTQKVSDGLGLVKEIIDNSDICRTDLLKGVEQSVYDIMKSNLNTSKKCCYNGPKSTLPPALPTTLPAGWTVTETTATFTPTIPGAYLPIPQVPVCTTEDIKNATSSSSICRFAEPKVGTPEYNTYQSAIAGGLVKGDCSTKKCPSGDYKEVMKGGSMLCEKCDIEKCNCGVKLNTYVPFIGRCIMNKQDNNSGQNGDTTTVNSLNAFPILMGALIKLLMSIIMILCFASLIVGGFMMTIPDQYDTGKGLVKKVIWTIVALGSLGTILYLINPNFFT